MPVAAFAPAKLHIDYAEWAAPGLAVDGYVWAWSNATGRYEPTALAFDPAGTAAAAVAAHVAAANPHSQYALAAALGTAAALNVGVTAGNVVQLDGSGRLPAVSGALLTNLPGGGSPGGSTTQVQYNNAGALAGHSGMTYSSANSRLTVTGGVVAPSMRPATDGTSALGWFTASGSQFVYGDTTNQRVGIGTIPATALDYKLDIVGNGTDVAGRTSLRIRNTSANSGARVTLENSDGNTLFAQVTGSSYLTGKSALFGTTGATMEFGTNRELSSGGTDVIYFATGGYETTNRFVVFTADKRIGIGNTSGITALLDLAASTTARASLRIRSGTAPTSPNDGDIWFDGTAFRCRIGGVTRTFTVT